MTPSQIPPREIGATDPLDSRIGTPRLPVSKLARVLRARAALGLAPAAAPAILFVPIGMLLGPQALGLISRVALFHLETVVSVALAALGVFVGLALDLRVAQDRRLLIAASAESVATIVVVGGALAFLMSRWAMPLDAGLLVVALALGLGASASSASGLDEADDTRDHRLVTRIADLDDVLPILVGGFVVALLHTGTPGHALQLTGMTILIGLAVAVAGWMLFERARGPAERGVFVVGTLLMLGGAAAHLSMSPLLAGLTAGVFWTLAPGRADAIIRNDLRKLQHPLVVLLLIVAGASVEWSAAAVWLLGPFVLFRLAGKLTGGWLAGRLVHWVMRPHVGAHLIPPGVIGIAFALNFHQVLPTPTGAVVVAAVAVGSLASEAIALIVLHEREAD